MKLVKKGEFPVVLFLVDENKISDFSEACPETGFTILHYLVAYYKMIHGVDNRIEKTIKNILSRSDVSDFINIQDSVYGNAPLHLAVMSKNFELAEKLIAAGANPKLRNKNEMFISTDSETDVMREVERQGIMSEVRKSPNSNIFIKKSMSDFNATDAEVDNHIKNMVDTLFKMEHKGGFSPSSATLSAGLPDALGVTEVAHNSISKASENPIADTEQFMDEMIRNYSKPQAGGRVTGSRKMTKAEFDDATESDMSGGFSPKNLSEMSELSRMIESQADETHKRVVDRIKELLKVDDVTARAYKALLYSKVKSEKPELNNFDRAVEMEKITTKEILETLNKDKLKEIKDHISVKDKERAEKPRQEAKPYKEKKPRQEKDKEVETATSEMSDTSSSEEPPKKEKKTKEPKAKKPKVKRSKAKKESRFSETSLDFLTSESSYSATSA